MTILLTEIGRMYKIRSYNININNIRKEVFEAMKTMHGTGVSGGIAMGKIAFFNKNKAPLSLTRIEDGEKEVLRFQQARDAASVQLERLYAKALERVGREDAAIFQIHLMLLSDRDYVDSAEAMIRGFDMNAEYAVKLTSDNFANMLARIDDPYMQGRAADIRDVSDRIIRILYGISDKIEAPEEPSIIVADEFVPSETIELGRQDVLGFISENGSSGSHAAILARNMQLPSIIGISELISEKDDGKEAIIDGFTGTVYLEPDESTVRRMKYRMQNVHSVNKLCLLSECQVG